MKKGSMQGGLLKKVVVDFSANKLPSKRSTKPSVASLKEQCIEVVNCLEEIAEKMGLAVTAIGTYRGRALEKLEVENSIELKEKFLLYKI